ncbi:MAG: NADAR family protein [Trebonia sp.]
MLFADDDAVPGILAAPHPREAKALGRKVRGFDDETWARHRFSLVIEGNVAKFGRHAGLRDFLLGTGGRVLVEASPRDRIWGIELGVSNELSADPGNWRGLNLLGFALMEVRCRLRGLAASAG